MGRDYRRAETKLVAKECKNAKATVDTGVLCAEFLVKQEAIQILCRLVVNFRRHIINLSTYIVRS